MADRLGGANLGSVDAGFQLLEEFGMPDRWGSEFAMRYPATNEPLLRGLFPLGPIPLDRRANPSAARVRFRFFFFFFRGYRAFGSGCVLRLRWTAGFARNCARTARQNSTSLIKRGNLRIRECYKFFFCNAVIICGPACSNN